MAIDIGQRIRKRGEVWVASGQSNMQWVAGKSKVKALVDAYNDLVSYFESESGAGGKLEGSTTARSIVNRMTNVMGAAHGGSGAVTILAQIGIERQQSSGTLKFDEAAFEGARGVCPDRGAEIDRALAAVEERRGSD